MVAIYRPGSKAPDVQFFEELTSLLEVLVTYNSKLIITGDINIHFENQLDRDTVTMPNS